MPEKVKLASDAKSKSYYKYYERTMLPIPEEKQAILKNPYGKLGEGMEIEDRNHIFDKKIEKGEVGIFPLKAGGFCVANTTKFKGVTGEMLTWFFGWHATDPLRYSIWDPYDHYGLEISEKDKAYILDPNTSIPDKSRNVTHTVLESLAAGKKPDKIFIHFDDPADLGFDKEKIFTDSCSFFVCAHAELGPMNVIMMHMARDTADGCELRSRFWMGYTKEGKVKLPFFLKWVMSRNLGNFLTRPDFVAYRYADRHDTLSNRLCLRRMVGVSWTIKTPEEYQTATAEGWIPIFEGFLP